MTQEIVPKGLLLLPFRQLLDAWECVSRERSLFTPTLDYLLELLTGALEVPYDVMDTGGGSSVKIVHVEPCQYTAAIAEVIKVRRKLFPPLVDSEEHHLVSHDTLLHSTDTIPVSTQFSSHKGIFLLQFFVLFSGVSLFKKFISAHHSYPFFLRRCS